MESLVEISRYYGKDPAYVIAGGGNTSCKTEKELFIKASGVSLATITRDGFVVMSREHLNLMEHKAYAEDAVKREEEVKQDLKGAVIRPEHLRPSVETSLHNLIAYRYVVHTHPTIVNALMCSQNSAREVEELFGADALYVAYTDPGYVLFKKIQARITEHVETHQEPPRIIFLQNHGIFVGADSTEEVKAIYRSIESRITAGRDMNLPAGEVEPSSTDTGGVVADYFKTKNLVSKAFRSPLVDYFTAGKERFQQISKPFTPDIIVYCKSGYLYLDSGLGKSDIVSRIEEFEKSHGYYPRVILQEKAGLILVEENERSLQTVLEVFLDMMKISYLSVQFGGPHFMTPEQIAFIDNWEVENYRRNVAKAG